jgi:hypothetical protein
MPCTVNPYVVFLGASPGNSPVAGDSGYLTRESYELPTAGIPHPGIYYPDLRHYFDRIRELGQIIIQSRAPGLTEPQTHALLGQLNLGTGGFGLAANAPLEQMGAERVVGFPQAIIRDPIGAFRTPERPECETVRSLEPARY